MAMAFRNAIWADLRASVVLDVMQTHATMIKGVEG
jgi:hypothetical protein